MGGPVSWWPFFCSLSFESSTLLLSLTASENKFRLGTRGGSEKMQIILWSIWLLDGIDESYKMSIKKANGLSSGELRQNSGRYWHRTEHSSIPFQPLSPAVVKRVNHKSRPRANILGCPQGAPCLLKVEEPRPA